MNTMCTAEHVMSVKYFSVWSEQMDFLEGSKTQKICFNVKTHTHSVFFWV